MCSLILYAAHTSPELHTHTNRYTHTQTHTNTRHSVCTFRGRDCEILRSREIYCTRFRFPWLFLLVLSAQLRCDCLSQNGFETPHNYRWVASHIYAPEMRTIFLLYFASSKDCLLYAPYALIGMIMLGRALTHYYLHRSDTDDGPADDSNFPLMLQLSAWEPFRGNRNSKLPSAWFCSTLDGSRAP